MRKYVWRYGFIVMLILTIVILLVLLQTTHIFIKAENQNLQEYMDMPADNTYIPSGGYIPDAQTAAKIGEAILDEMCEDTFLDLGMITVKYDKTNRLWKVTKGYLFHQNAFVVIEQDSGKVIRALFAK